MPDDNKKTKEVDRTFNPSSAAIRNTELLWVLSFIPEFKKEIETTREKFKIDPTKFNKKSTLDNIILIQEWFESNNEEFFIEDTPKILLTGNARPFWDHIQKIGDKFNLQGNFTNSLLYGVPHLIFTDHIVAPATNWSVTTHFSSKGTTAKWVTLNIYAPLLSDEAIEGFEQANEAFKQVRPAKLPSRARTEFVNILPFLDILVTPNKKIKVYDSFYLTALAKSKSATAAEIKRAERLHASSISFKWTRESVKDIAKRSGIPEDTLEKMFERINKMAKTTFKHGLK
jgi:hypothetical protein